MLDMDDDNDGVPDSGDEFPKDAEEWEDLNNDGLGDNGDPLSLTDKMKLSPGISALAILAIMSLAGAMIYSTAFSGKGYPPLSRLISRRENSVQDAENPPSQIESTPTPVPPGLTDVSENEQNYAKSWEDLPPGGQYTGTNPMRYEGEECGIWEQRVDESWIRK